MFGLPLSSPVLEFSVMPEGNVPPTPEKVTGAVPREVVIVDEYGVATIASGKVGGVLKYGPATVLPAEPAPWSAAISEPANARS